MPPCPWSSAACSEYMQHKNDVPANHLVQVSFEELEKDPLATLKRIYLALGWASRFEALVPRFQAYCKDSNIKDFKRNQHNKCVRWCSELEISLCIDYVRMCYAVCKRGISTLFSSGQGLLTFLVPSLLHSQYHLHDFLCSSNVGFCQHEHKFVICSFFRLDPEMEACVRDRWSASFKEFGYSR